MKRWTATLVLIASHAAGADKVKTPLAQWPLKDGHGSIGISSLSWQSQTNSTITGVFANNTPHRISFVQIVLQQYRDPANSHIFDSPFALITDIPANSSRVFDALALKGNLGCAALLDHVEVTFEGYAAVRFSAPSGTSYAWYDGSGCVWTKRRWEKNQRAGKAK